jgi:hypothetical protein
MGGPCHLPLKRKKLIDSVALGDAPAVVYPASMVGSYVPRADMESASPVRQSRSSHVDALRRKTSPQSTQLRNQGFSRYHASFASRSIGRSPLVSPYACNAGASSPNSVASQACSRRTFSSPWQLGVLMRPV